MLARYGLAPLQIADTFSPQVLGCYTCHRLCIISVPIMGIRRLLGPIDALLHKLIPMMEIFVNFRPIYVSSHIHNGKKEIVISR